MKVYRGKGDPNKEVYMTDIILSTQNGEPVASSRQIAENFGKEHKDVLRAIENIKAQNCALTSMFFEATYTAGTGKQYPMCLMNRDGFSLLVMGFTGKAALEWKLKYIAAFNAMEKKLAQRPQMPKLSKELQALFLLDDRTQRQEQRITALENNMVVDYDQQLSLKNAVNHVVVEALGGKNAPAYGDSHVRGMVYCEINKDIQMWFRVSSRNNIPRKRFDEAVEYIQRWKPSTNTVMLIQQSNGQTSMF